ncbi:3-dehydroquinate dehydratase (3-dehydroquinase) [Dimargaris xerosporica]|nr:3-dehydroquinate dehydratase (3-dehydroquinase) [Dimargaris xerosporica]
MTLSPQLPLPAPRDVTTIPVLGRDAIVVGFHLVDTIVHHALSQISVSTYVLVTDACVGPLYLGAFESAFATLVAQGWPQSAAAGGTSGRAKPRMLTYVIPAGETSKCRETKAQIEDFMLSQACTRDTCVLALGGGVVGDLVGYVAATFMRGVPVIQIPTSLLAMVDSSIGGKTAIDTPHGKNLIGAFWQPHRIFIDLHFLATLLEREFCNGMAEVIKTATIWCEEDFNLLETHPDDIRAAVLASTASCTAAASADGEPVGALAGNRTAQQKLLLQVVTGSARVKAHVVSADERESGLRGLLNFGHTVGHGIEALIAPQLLHGECVAIGMVLESEIARHLGYMEQVSLARLVRCLRAYSLPVALHDKIVVQRTNHAVIRINDIMRVMKVDKKNLGATKRMALPARIGKTVDTKPIPVSDDVIQTVISPGVQVQPVAPNQGAPLRDGQMITVTVPGSKSISNRALVLAALGSGTCRIQNLLHSDDTQVMLNALEQLGGCQYEWEDDGRTLAVTGGEGRLHVPDVDLYLGNAGTAARFLTTVVTLVPEAATSAGRQTTILTGNARMKERPIGPLVQALQANGTVVRCLEQPGCLPLEVTPQPQRLAGGIIQLAASISSQYVSSILLCAPYATQEITLELTGGKVISQPYIDMTIAMMASFGIHVQRLADNVYRIPQGVYTNPSVYQVESDASSATYPLAVAAITGSSCTIGNIGSASLQGDAQFAVQVLRPMGCQVTQTKTSTTVQGPPMGQLRPLPHVDMEPMTDAFLTASVLAAVAQPTTAQEEPVTRITGIANQRVKECNRIAVMVEELGRFGVQASELPDGIQIHGRTYSQLQGPASGVACHDDHRVAMSFSVLGCVVPGGTALRERKCVEKTWPNWWDALEHQLGVHTVGFDTQATGHPESAPSAVAQSTTSATIVLVGMRGSGKTTLGRAAARALGRTFVDMDEYFEQQLKVKVADMVTNQGWDAFRVAETNLLTQALGAYPENALIACGGGIVETAAGCKVLQTYMADHQRTHGRPAPVVQVTADIDHIVAYLAQDQTRPSYGEDVRAVWDRRRPQYKQCTQYEFPIYLPQLTSNAQLPALRDVNHWPYVERDFIRFLQFITGQRPLPTCPDALPKFFVSLTVPNLHEAQSIVPYVVEGCDAVELRVDLLQEFPNQPAHQVSDDYVRNQLGLLRRSLPHSLPVIFTVRTKSQGGQFEDAHWARATELLARGLAWGCEYLDVEVRPTLSPADGDLHRLITSKGFSQIIGSWHDPSGAVAWSSTTMKTRYRQAAALGDIVKLVSVARTMTDNMMLHQFAEHHRQLPQAKPLVALNMGPIGQWSRVMCPYLAPVTHVQLPTKAAPGQLSVAEICQARTLLGQIPRQHYYLFGTPIAHSLSPLLHNTGFTALGLPHHYGLVETDSSAAFAKMFQQPDFGGASITIPLKEKVICSLDELSPEAQAIGAVNTVFSSTDADGLRTLKGDNTDWKGIVGCLERAFCAQPCRPESTPNRSLEGLVIGAGGTSRAALYALYRMGCTHIFLFNRTAGRAHALVESLKLPIPITVLTSLDAPPAVTVIISTIPATDIAFALPDALFAGCPGGVALDMAYKPRRTPLLQAAERHGWGTVEGIEVLIEQGLHQFAIWTGLQAPATTMREIVLKDYLL